jgi:hypothetical protein
MADPINSTQLASQILAQVGLVFTTPALLGVVVIVIGGTFVATRWLLQVQIDNARSDKSAASDRAEFWKERYELEEKQHQALKASVAAEKGPLAAGVQELRTGTKEFRDLVIKLGLGGEFRTPINPSEDPANWLISVPVDRGTLRDWAALANTTASGFATTVHAPDGTFVTSGTPAAASATSSFTASPSNNFTDFP